MAAKAWRHHSRGPNPRATEEPIYHHAFIIVFPPSAPRPENFQNTSGKLLEEEEEKEEEEEEEEGEEEAGNKLYALTYRDGLATPREIDVRSERSERSNRFMLLDFLMLLDKRRY